MRAKRHGKNGQDVVIEVPPGTVALRGDVQISDLTQDDQEFIAAKGGRGGFGNAHFKSSTRRAPRVAEVGESGEADELKLELKLIADVGLVGLPNAGKSTLLSVVSNARPAIADYPFTTLTPNLGVVDVSSTSLLFADIPGLIAGASKGKGLGDEFLRHIERTSVLIHLIDGTDAVAKNYQTIQAELKNYQINLSKKPQLIVLNKIDALQPDQIKKLKAKLKQASGQTPLAISAVAKTNVRSLLSKTAKLVAATKKKADQTKAQTKAVPVIELPEGEGWQVVKKGQHFVVSGAKIESFAKRTDPDNEYAVRRLKDIMRKMGIAQELKRHGAQSGDRVKIANKFFKL